jgi:hypothetical protein
MNQNHSRDDMQTNEPDDMADPSQTQGQEPDDMAAKTKSGRKPVPKELKTEVVSFKTTPSRKMRYQQTANLDNRSLASWIEITLDKATQGGEP